MKGKNPTREQRKWLEYDGLNSREWLIQKDTSAYIQAVNRETREIRVINKER